MTQGWTGNKCPECKGTGGTDNNEACPYCGGSGDEYGEIDEDTKRIEEPPR